MYLTNYTNLILFNRIAKSNLPRRKLCPGRTVWHKIHNTTSNYIRPRQVLKIIPYICGETI